jgi:hypothetical protein
MMRTKQDNTESRRSATWQVFVGFDDQQAQQSASEICDFLTQHFGDEFEFEVQLCDLNCLGEPGKQREAIEQAASAKILVFATSAKQSPTPPVLEWMEGLCAQRRAREGALVGLVCRNAPEELRDEIEIQLRQVAHRAGLDYLTHAPDCRALRIPNESEWVDARAAQLTGVLESILSTSRSPDALLGRSP